MRISTVLAAIVLVMAVSACSSGGSVAGGNGQAAPHCYATADGTGSPFTIAELGSSDCTNLATAADMSLASLGYSATPNTSEGPGSVICDGMVNGNTVTVIATFTDPALCDQLGLSPVS